MERRQREREQRRESIVEAAERTFLQEGYEASTMEQVAVAAEVSKGTLYLYFRSKDELRLAIAERWVRTLIEKLRPRLETAGSGIAGVRGVLETYEQHFREKPNHCRMTLQWINGPPPAECEGEGFEHHRNRVRESVSLVMGTIERGKADGTIRPDVDARLLSLELWGSFLGVWMMVMNAPQVQSKMPSPLDLDRHLAAAHFETLLRGIAGPKAEEADLRFDAGRVEEAP